MPYKKLILVKLNRNTVPIVFLLLNLFYFRSSTLRVLATVSVTRLGDILRFSLTKFLTKRIPNNQLLFGLCFNTFFGKKQDIFDQLLEKLDYFQFQFPTAGPTDYCYDTVVCNESYDTKSKIFDQEVISLLVSLWIKLDLDNYDHTLLHV